MLLVVPTSAATDTFANAHPHMSSPELQPQAPAPLQVHLSVRADGQAILATVVFRNVSQASISATKTLLCTDGILRTSLFNVTDAAGHRIPFVGPSVKMSPPTAADIVNLEPGATYTSQVRLDLKYAMESVTGRYTIQYATVAHFPEIGGTQRVRSNIVEVDLHR